MRVERLYTVGVYGFTPQTFAAALSQADIDVLCDIRARRGLRGSEYAWANSRRLQQLLAELDVAYAHLRALAPSEAARSAQRDADKLARTAKRVREQFSDEFRDLYEQDLEQSAARQAMTDVITAGRRPVLLCVERSPDACHRLLVAARINARHGMPIEHLMP